MNETIQTLLSRRSIRAYTREAVSPEALELIITCGLYAPSGGNHQEVRLFVVQDPAVLSDLVELVRSEFRKKPLVEGAYWTPAILRSRSNPNYDFHFGAPVLILAAVPEGWPNGMADSANALENMQLAAASLGLGSCWVNQLHWLADSLPLRAYLRHHGVSEGETITGSIVLGHPAPPLPRAAPRKEGRVHYI